VVGSEVTGFEERKQRGDWYDEVLRYCVRNK